MGDFKVGNNPAPVSNRDYMSQSSALDGFAGENQPIPGGADGFGAAAAGRVPEQARKKTSLLGAAARFGTGWAELHIPVVGNLLSLVQAGGDLVSGIGSLFDKKKSGVQKLEGLENLLFHTIGIVDPKVAGHYDEGRGEVQGIGSIAEKLGVPVDDNQVEAVAGIWGGIDAVRPRGPGSDLKSMLSQLPGVDKLVGGAQAGV